MFEKNHTNEPVAARRLRRWLGAWRRWSLWMALVLLVGAMLVTLVWLAGRYEVSQVQDRLERDAANAVVSVRTAFARNLQSLQALEAGDPALPAWQARAGELLAARRELARIELHDARLRLLAHADSPYRTVLWDVNGRGQTHSETMQACANAQRLKGASYSRSYFQPMPQGLGAEMMEVCLPLEHDGKAQGFVVATYVLQTVLAEIAAPKLQITQGISFTEADGTRLALVGARRRGTRKFTAQQLFDLPGVALVVRLEGWHAAPQLFPNLLTALVTAMSIALVAVLVVLVRDNRRRLRAERDLGDALAFRKAMEDSLVTGLRARDLQGRITYVNPAFCAMVGYNVQELLGQVSPLPYWPPEHAQEYAERQQARMAGLQPASREGFETVFVRRDGTRFPVMIYEAALINAQGVHTGWMGSFMDVGAQRRVEELSRASQERLQATARLATVGEMASLLSHELNQPLAAIASYANGSLNLLQDGVPDLAQVRMALERIAGQSGRAGRVIKSVHDFVRRRAHTREPVAAQELLDAVLPIIRLQARKLGVDVQLQLAPGLPPALCDRTMVEQVLLNLTRNAMQAMDAPQIDPRVLRLGCVASGAGWLEFSVADGGVGIDADVLERLFTPFFTTRAEGMGLGLSLCRTVVEQHGGHLRHAPRQPRGTVFTFTLPAYPNH